MATLDSEDANQKWSLIRLAKSYTHHATLDSRALNWSDIGTLKADAR